jgi:hypothetical protein
MGLLDVAKDAYDKFTGDTRQGDTRPIASTVSNAKIIYWHYVVQNFGSSTSEDLSVATDSPFARAIDVVKKVTSVTASKDIFEIERGWIDAEILDVQTSKSITSAAGSFRISLLASTNWKKKLAPGDWLAIYLFQGSSDFNTDNPGSKNMVMLGNIDRISKTKQRDEETDKVLVRYTISGRDFGKTLEDCVAWFNPYAQPKELVGLVLTTAGLAFAGNPSSIVRQLMGLFFGEKSSLGQYNIARNISDNVNQAKIPSGILEVFSETNDIAGTLKDFAKEALPDLPGASSLATTGDDSEFYSNLVSLEIDDNLPGFKPVSMLSQASSGESIWSTLKKESNSLVNDLYVDLIKDEDGNATPTLVLTPHPNSNFFEDTPGALNDVFLKMTDLYEISMPNSRIKYEDLGRDDNSRINMVWLETRQAIGKMTQTAAYIEAADSNGIGLPMYQRESIIRYGQKIWDQALENCYESRSGSGYNKAADIAKNEVSGFDPNNTSVELYRSFINQIYDLNAYNHLYETGSITSIGDSRAQLGTCLRIRSDFDDDDRLYFVEGYSHTWTFPNQWETEWNVTHGQFDNETNPFIDIDESDGGQADNETNRRYLVKTNFSK